MSEEQEQQPQPEQPEPQTQPIAPSQNAAKTPKDSPKRDLSFKSQTLKTLNSTIESLKAGLVKLQAKTPQPPADPIKSQPVPPSKTSVSVKVEAIATTQPDDVAEVPELLIETVSEVPTPPVKETPKKVPTPAKPSFLDKLSSAWLTLVRLVRSLLPASANQKLSGTVLSGAIAAILIVAIGTTLSLLLGKPSEIAVVPSPESPKIIVIPSPEPTATNLPTLVAPEETKPVEIAPPQPPKLTPEQNLIVTIQKQVDEITNQFNGGLIKSIQVNFLSSLLTVKVGDDWYSLPESEQNQLATKMFQQTQKLEFRKLEIANSQGKLIARSPVIGSEMIILERKKLVVNG